jgi:hypothetical protein
MIAATQVDNRVRKTRALINPLDIKKPNHFRWLCGAAVSHGRAEGFQSFYDWLNNPKILCCTTKSTKHTKKNKKLSIKLKLPFG